MVARLGEAVVPGANSWRGLGSGFLHPSRTVCFVTNFHVIEGQGPRFPSRSTTKKGGQLSAGLSRCPDRGHEQVRGPSCSKVEDQHAPDLKPWSSVTPTAFPRDQVFAIGSPLGLERTRPSLDYQHHLPGISEDLYPIRRRRRSIRVFRRALFQPRGRVGSQHEIDLLREGAGICHPRHGPKVLSFSTGMPGVHNDNPSNPRSGTSEPPSRFEKARFK